MVGSDVQPPKRIQLKREELESLSKEEIIEKWLQQDSYLDLLESNANNSAESSELVSLRESEEKLKLQQLEASRRENVLVMRLTTKEQEMQEYAHQIQELKGLAGPAGGSGTAHHLRAALLDPAVNLLFDRMKREVEATRARLQETQNELSAWKFTPDRCTKAALLLSPSSLSILVVSVVSTGLAAPRLSASFKLPKVREGRTMPLPPETYRHKTGNSLRRLPSGRDWLGTGCFPSERHFARDWS